jgi:hypothetical protein
MGSSCIDPLFLPQYQSANSLGHFTTGERTPSTHCIVNCVPRGLSRLYGVPYWDLNSDHVVFQPISLHYTSCLIRNSFLMTRTLKKGITLSVSISIVNWSYSLCCAESRGSWSGCFMYILLTVDNRELPISMPSFCWNNISSIWQNKILKNLQQFYDGFCLQDRQFHQSVIVWCLLLMTCKTGLTDAVVKRLMSRLTGAS